MIVGYSRTTLKKTVIVTSTERVIASHTITTEREQATNRTMARGTKYAPIVAVSVSNPLPMLDHA